MGVQKCLSSGPFGRTLAVLVSLRPLPTHRSLISSIHSFTLVVSSVLILISTRPSPSLQTTLRSTARVFDHGRDVPPNSPGCIWLFTHPRHLRTNGRRDSQHSPPILGDTIDPIQPKGPIQRAASKSLRFGRRQTRRVHGDSQARILARATHGDHRHRSKLIH